MHRQNCNRRLYQGRIQEFLRGGGGGSGSWKRQVRRNFQTDKQEKKESAIMINSMINSGCHGDLSSRKDFDVLHSTWTSQMWPHGAGWFIHETVSYQGYQYLFLVISYRWDGMRTSWGIPMVIMTSGNESVIYLMRIILLSLLRPRTGKHCSKAECHDEMISSCLLNP